MASDTLKGKWALVTGASSGLGVDFAQQLAAMGCHLVLVARREAELRSLAERVKHNHSVETMVYAMDLTAEGAVERLYDELTASGKRIDILVNNAGFGVYGEFKNIPWERERQMLELDILTLVHLTKKFLPDMLNKGSGYILQVASIGGYQATPTYASYAAAKAFVLNFGEAINYELRHTGVSCTVVSPGITATEFLKVSGQRASLYQRIMMMQSPEVVRIGLRAMLRRRPSVVPGWLNAISVWFNRLMPRRLSTAAAYHLMTK